LSELIPLYSIKVHCCNCEHEFSTSRVRPSLKKAMRRDADFCSYYKNENPDYYVVRVCPECGFASTENSADKLADWQRKAFNDQLGKRWKTRDFGGKRSWEEALETYKLALSAPRALMTKTVLLRVFFIILLGCTVIRVRQLRSSGSCSTLWMLISRSIERDGIGGK
jgi:uncharacterized protein (DUF2225 family)